MAWHTRIQTLPEQSRRLVAFVFLAIAGAALFAFFIIRTRSSVAEISFTRRPPEENRAPLFSKEFKEQEVLLSPLEGLAESLKGFEETARRVSETLRPPGEDAHRVFQFTKRFSAFATRTAHKAAEMLYGAFGREVIPKEQQPKANGL